MKKFGFGRKKDADSGPPPPSNNSNNNNSSNPYAADAGSNDPYLNNAPPPYSGASSQTNLRDNKSPVPPGGYTGAGGVSNQYGGLPRDNRFGAGPAPNRGPPSDRSGPTPPQDNRYGAPPAGGDRYGAGSYGNSGGFGQDRYGSGGAQPASRYGAGGYGNFGSGPQPPSNASTPNAPGSRPPPSNGPGMNGSGAAGGPGGPGGPGAPAGRYGAYGGGAPASDYGNGSNPSYGGGSSYGAYEERELTAEEQEEEDINASKQEMRFLKQQSAASSANALRMAEQAYATGLNTLGNLEVQGEALHNTNDNLSQAGYQNKVASGNTDTLNRLTKRPFFIPEGGGNPFTSAKRLEAKHQKVVEENRRIREEGGERASARYQDAQRQAEFGKQNRELDAPRQTTKANLLARSKYQFEADDEDEALEEDIENNLDNLSLGVSKLKGLAGAIGREVESQNQQLDNLGRQADKVDDQLAYNTARLNKIK